MVPAAWSGPPHPGARLENAMDAAVWTAIGLLAATSLGTLFYLGSRIDALAARMDAGFDRVHARFDHIDDRFAQVDTQVRAGGRQVRRARRSSGRPQRPC
jgi:hypothetical protein